MLKVSKVFWLILILAFVVRFYKLGQIPPGLDWDEVSNAYNAYSILKTAKDEYGNFLPLANRSFDDYKPPLYMYLEVPAVAIFGLTPFAARLPSAIFGFLTVPLIYLLAKRLFANDAIALLSALFLAISPWHIQFSRAGFESNIGLFFSTAAIVSFLYGIKNRKLLIFTAIFASAGVYAYHTQRIFIPLIFAAAALIYKKEISTIGKRTIVELAILALLLVLPLLVFLPREALFQRLESASSESRRQDVERSIKYIEQDRQSDFPLGNIIHNRRVVIFQSYIQNYLAHFDLNFLFTRGDGNFRHHIGDMGMLYLYQLPLVLFGAYRLVKNSPRTNLFILIMLLAAPIAAVFVYPSPHANRALPMVVAFELISAYALVKVFAPMFILKKAAQILSILIITISFLVYLHNYYAHYAREKASFWQYGYLQAAQISQKYQDRFDKILIDRSIEQAYVFWLFSLRYDPASFQQQGWRGNFDKYYFDSKPPQNSSELFVSAADIFPEGFVLLDTIYFPNGQEAIKIGYPR